MNTPAKFSIGTPCKEDWNEMTPKEQGRFCALCQKCVVDLTKKSQAEIAEIYAENEGNVCGRMTVAQVKEARQSTQRQFYWFGKGLQRMQRLALAFFAAFTLWFAPVQAQSTEKQEPRLERLDILGDVMVAPSGNSKVSGVIYWKGGMAVKGKVWVSLDGPESAEVSEGEYVLNYVEPGERVLTVYSEAHRAIIWEQKIRVPDGGLVKDIELDRKSPEIILDHVEMEDQIEYIVDEPAVLGGLEVIDDLVVMPVKETVEWIQPEKVRMGKIKRVEVPLEAETLEPERKEPDDPLKSTLTLETQPENNPGQEAASSGPQGTGSLKAFPNPTRDLLRLEFPKALSGKVTVRIHDLDGTMLEETELQVDRMRKYAVSLAKYTAGIYLISVESQGYAAETKAVKL